MPAVDNKSAALRQFSSVSTKRSGPNAKLETMHASCGVFIALRQTDGSDGQAMLSSGSEPANPLFDVGAVLENRYIRTRGLPEQAANVHN
jgi:hypothetical protein